jgi:hypothetical protein
MREGRGERRRKREDEGRKRGRKNRENKKNKSEVNRDKRAHLQDYVKHVVHLHQPPARFQKTSPKTQTPSPPHTPRPGKESLALSTFDGEYNRSGASLSLARKKARKASKPRGRGRPKPTRLALHVHVHVGVSWK